MALRTCCDIGANEIRIASTFRLDKNIKVHPIPSLSKQAGTLLSLYHGCVLQGCIYHKIHVSKLL
jgi:hypothetical protein